MTARKAPAKKAAPAAAARRAEAEDGYISIEQCGVSLRIPVQGKTPVAAMDAFLEGDSYRGLKLLVGNEQWKQLLNAGMTRDDLEELDKKLTESQGN